MSLEKVANEDATLDHDVDEATLSITTPAKIKVKAGGKKVYAGPMTIVVSNAVSGSCVSAAGVVVITPTAEKVKVESSLVIREGDEGTGMATGVEGTQACTFDITVSIDEAGQSKVRAQ
jgi:hypothetical protein